MGELPLSVFISPVVVVVVVVATLLWRRKMLATSNVMYSAFKLGDLAGRMGLQIAEGDPGFNLMLAANAHHSTGYAAAGGVVGRVMGDGVKETRARLVGSPFGHPMEFSFYWHEHFQAGFVENVTTHTFECRLSVSVAAPFPDFEILLRNPQGAWVAATPQLPLPPQPFGLPHLDGVFALTAADPRIGPVLAPALNGALGLTYVHLIGQNGRVHFTADHTTFATAVYYLETMERVLELIACTLEGRPLPTLPPAPQIQLPAVR